jgi:hypothetical protein
MKTAALTICTLFCLNLALLAEPQAMVKPRTDGRGAAMQWLAVVDAGKYRTSWDLASKTFQASVSKAHWALGMDKVRRFYGEVLSRKFKDSAYAVNPPGFAPGEYEMVLFKVRLGMQGAATEAVFMEMKSYGVWQVAGYTITLKNQVQVLPLKFLNHR